MMNMDLWWSRNQTYGETIHKFVERRAYDGIFMPGYEPRNSTAPVRPVGLEYVDHCVGNGSWAKWMSGVVMKRLWLFLASHF